MNTTALRSFLDEHFGDDSEIHVERMAGGGSCEVFAVDRKEDQRWVLRRRPPAVNIETAHDVLREFRILVALEDSAVPTPCPIVACDDPHVFGAPFYVMERVDGVPVRSQIPQRWLKTDQTTAIRQLFDVLAEIHMVPWKAGPLAGLPTRHSALDTQIPRWRHQLDTYQVRELQWISPVGDWLEEHRPPNQPAALTHGDFKLDNVLYSASAHTRLLAVVDWEMAGLGDPLVDLAWALIFTPGERATVPLGSSAPHCFDPCAVPSHDSLVERYRTRTGRDTTALSWYEIFARWKLAIVLEGTYAKYIKGQSHDDRHQRFGPLVELLLRRCEALVEEY